MKRTSVNLLLFFALLLAAAPAAAATPLAVTVSIPPQRYFIEQIGGDQVAVTVMVAPGRDPHTYEPTAAQMQGIAAAEAYFTIGAPFENHWVPKFSESNPAMRIVRLPDAITGIEDNNGHALSLAMQRHGNAPHEHGPETDDPHVWLSPEAMLHTVPAMAKALAELRPEHAAVFAKRAEALADDIRALDAELRALFVPLRGRVFLSFHQSWTWYAHNYSLREASVELGGREPGPKSMAMLLDFAARHKARVIVASPMTSKSAVAAIAGSIKGTVISADPLAADWPGFLRAFSHDLAAALEATEEQP